MYSWFTTDYKGTIASNSGLKALIRVGSKTCALLQASNIRYVDSNTPFPKYFTTIKRSYDAFEDDVELIINTTSAQEAAQMAYHLAKKGDTVLLSPACASFDLFENYEDRGNQFKKAVKDL